MLHHHQAKSLDDIYLEDIPNIIHPDSAERDLAYTAQPNRIGIYLEATASLSAGITRSTINIPGWHTGTHWPISNPGK